MKKGEIKDEIKEILRMSFKCGFVTGVNYAIKGKEIANREIFEQNIEKISDEYESMAFKNVE